MANLSVPQAEWNKLMVILKNLSERIQALETEVAALKQVDDDDDGEYKWGGGD